MKMNSMRWTVVLGLALVAVALALSWHIGPARGLPREAILELRMARTLLGLGVGALLATSGCMLQTLFRNPLCEPTTLGLSAGAALGCVVTLSLGWAGYVWIGSLGGFAGTVLFGGIILWTASKPSVRDEGLILVGLLMGLVGSSLVALWMALSDAQGIANAIFWMTGDLGRYGFTTGILILCLAVLSVMLGLMQSRRLDCLLWGREAATSLGINVHRFRFQMLMLVALQVALAVSVAGMIGFVGLVVPWMIRLAVGSLHRRVILASAIWGGALLALADLVARSLVSDRVVPVGVVTTILGAPLLVVLVSGARKRRTSPGAVYGV